MSPSRVPKRRLPLTGITSSHSLLQSAGTMFSFLVLFATLLVLSGCQATAPMRTIGIDVRTPEKDVLIFDIAVEEPTDPRCYRDWAIERLQEVAGEPVNELYPGVPIYEVWYRFRFRGETTAEVIFRRTDDGMGPLQHLHTMIQNLPDEFGEAGSQ